MLNKQEQTQTAGDGSVQTQNINCTIVNNNTDIELVRTIAQEVCSKEVLNVCQKCTQEAMTIALNRDMSFTSLFTTRIVKLESAIESLRDPRFQYLIQDARESAAQTDSVDDWLLLTELLVDHEEEKNDRMMATAISQAIKIIGKIDHGALCGMTVFYILSRYFPIISGIHEGLKSMNEVLTRCVETPLPYGYDWLDHLDVLGAIRLSNIGSIKKSKEFLTDRYHEYACIGIKEGTEEHRKANEILDAYNINRSLLVPNKCLDGYVRMNISSMQFIKPQYKEPVSKILDLYCKDKSLQGEVNTNFLRIWDSYEALKIVREWWDNCNGGFNLTSIGNVIAQANACKIVPSLPNLLKK